MLQVISGKHNLLKRLIRDVYIVIQEIQIQNIQVGENILIKKGAQENTTSIRQFFASECVVMTPKNIHSHVRPVGWIPPNGMKSYEPGINGFRKWAGVGARASGKLLKKRNIKGTSMKIRKYMYFLCRVKWRRRLPLVALPLYSYGSCPRLCCTGDSRNLYKNVNLRTASLYHKHG